MQDNKKILVHYSSPNIVGERMDIALTISNEFGFVSDAVALFNKRGEQPGTTRCSLRYDETKSNETESTFSGTIKFDSPGYRTFYIGLKINGQVRKIEYDAEEDCAVFANGRDFAFWECFSHYYFKTPEWIKGAVMYQIFVDLNCLKNLMTESFPGIHFLSGKETLMEYSEMIKDMVEILKVLSKNCPILEVLFLKKPQLFCILPQ